MALSDRVAVITGAGGGLGRVVAARMAGEGARLALVGSRLEPLEALGAELRLARDRWSVHAADLRDEKAAAGMVEAVVARYGRVDILVHAVGGWTGGTPIAELPAADLDAMLQQHVRTTFNVTKALTPHLVANGWGRVVAITTPLAAEPPAKMAPYSVGKAAEEALLGTLARETAGTGVTVNVLRVRTIDVRHERDSAPTPKNAAWTTPEEIAAAMLYLCSDEARVVNGARIPLYGGA